MDPVHSAVIKISRQLLPLDDNLCQTSPSRNNRFLWAPNATISSGIQNYSVLSSNFDSEKNLVYPLALQLAYYGVILCSVAYLALLATNVFDPDSYEQPADVITETNDDMMFLLNI